MQHTTNTGKKAFAIFLAGLTAGYIASWFMPEDWKFKQRKVVRKKISELQAIMTDPEERERIKDIFKEKTEEALDQYQEARSILMKNLADIKGSWQDIDKDKYLEVVGNTIDEIRDNQALPMKQLQKMRQYFEADYKLLQSKAKKAAADVA